MRVTHTKVSGVADGPDPDEVQPSDWNDDHVIEGLAEGSVVIAEAELLNIDLLQLDLVSHTIIPAPGTGMFIAVLGAWAHFQYGSNSFDVNGSDPTLCYGNGFAPFNGTFKVEGITGNSFQPSFDLSPDGSFDRAEFANKALKLMAPGPLEGGIDCALKVFVAYTVLLV